MGEAPRGGWGARLPPMGGAAARLGRRRPCLADDVPFPVAPPTVRRGVLETTWRTTPENVVNAQQLALVRQRAGEQAGSDEIIVTVAHGENAPPWFVDKAAWILARAGRTGEAVELLLRPR